jgi:hypothetical protein
MIHKDFHKKSMNGSESRAPEIMKTLGVRYITGKNRLALPIINFTTDATD